MDRPIRIALRAGHHDTSGGNPVEYSIVGPLTQALAVELVNRGHDVRVINPDGPDADDHPGDGDFPGGLGEAAFQAVIWSRQGWTPDLYLELHTDSANRRGAFAVYPDWGNDVDTEGRDGLGPAICKAIARKTSIPVRDGGSMSEKQTYVGGTLKSRLGAFAATVSLRTTTSRLILECGSHVHPHDLGVLRTRQAEIAAAIADGIEEFYGAPFRGFAVAPAPDPDRRYFAETGQWLALGFKRYWEENGGLPVFGYPITGEFEEGGKTVQYFERARLEYDKETGQITRGLVGSELRAAQARIRELERRIHELEAKVR